MNIHAYRIVKQPNGKYALYDTSACEISFTNRKTPQEIRDFLIGKAGRILDESIQHHAQDTGFFDLFVSDYKQAKGLTPDEEIREAVINELSEMGVSVAGL